MKSQKIHHQLSQMAQKLKSTLSFRQQAPLEKKKQKDPAALDVTELFSHFTANIMKEEVIFTR